jgi:hypothetical protein
MKKRERREQRERREKRESSLTAFRTVTNIAGRDRGFSVERWDRIGRQRDEIEQRSHMPEYNSSISVSSKEIDSILEKSKISYEVQVP